MDKNHTKLIQHRLTRRIRRIIMGLLFLSFFVMSPLIILYTAGYRYDITQHKIKQKGVLSVDIKPTDATVYLNNIKIDKKLNELEAKINQILEIVQKIAIKINSI